MPTMVTLYTTAWGKRFRERLTAAGKAPMLIIGAMMRNSFMSPSASLSQESYSTRLCMGVDGDNSIYSYFGQ